MYFLLDWLDSRKLPTGYKLKTFKTTVPDRFEWDLYQSRLEWTCIIYPPTGQKISMMSYENRRSAVKAAILLASM